MNTTLKLLASAAILSASTASMAAVTGEVAVKLNVGAGCEVLGATDDGKINKFGNLNFGNTSSTWNNVLNAELASEAGGKIEIKCDDAVKSFGVAINAGANGDRQLKGPAGGLVKYQVYQDVARNTEYAVDTKVDFPITAGETVQVPVFGSIPKGDTTDTGAFTDTLLVNITF